MVSTLDQREVTDEAIRVLLAHLDPAKVALFLTTWKGGAGDYSMLREELLGRLSVDQLIDELQKWRVASPRE